MATFPFIRDIIAEAPAVEGADDALPEADFGWSASEPAVGEGERTAKALSVAPVQAAAPIALDVNKYEDRMRLLGLLNQAHPPPLGWPNPQDGIRLQTEWQRVSGRDQHGWWADANYTLTVWQMQALQSRGEFKNVQILGAEPLKMPPQIRDKILKYYDTLEAAHHGPSTRAAKDNLQKVMWDFHVDAIRTGVANAEPKLRQLPPGEHQFAEAWGKTLVEYLAIANFPTDGKFISPINSNILPLRLLNADDINPLQASNLPPQVRAGVLGMIELHQFDRATSGRMQGLLKEVVDRVPGGRNFAIDFLEKTIEAGQAAGRFLHNVERILQEILDRIPRLPDLFSVAPEQQTQLPELAAPGGARLARADVEARLSTSRGADLVA